MNWDSFVPDLIVGVVTGLVVGAALLGAQWIAERRRTQSDALFAWESLRPQLRAATFRSWEQSMDGFLPVPASLAALVEAGGTAPLQLWQSRLKVADPAIVTLLLILRTRHALESAARAADTAIDFAVIPIATRLNFNPHALSRAIRSRAFNHPEDDLARTLGLQSKDEPQYRALIASAAEAETDPRLAEALVRVFESFDIYAELLKRLKSQLAEEEPPASDRVGI